jgi:hypothetical protein
MVDEVVEIVEMEEKVGVWKKDGGRGLSSAFCRWSLISEEIWAL